MLFTCLKKYFLFCLLVLSVFFSCSPKSAAADTAVAPIAGEKSVEAAAETPEPSAAMVYYEGNVLNIFFHPLVARPETAFRNREHREHFLEWYVTAGEYRKILYELYMDNFVLVDIYELFEVTHTDGVRKLSAKKVLVPEGKKPMVLSIDDLSYYDFVRENASVSRLILDDRGGVAAWTDAPGGGEISYDLDVVTYLEEFIKKYPDFSLRGAKGIIALTGYEGLLGYRTHLLEARDYNDEKEKAIAVVNRLKDMGWRFASHSWGHINIPGKPMSWLTYDQKLWDQQVKPILGETDLFIYPFGAGVENQEEKHKYLRDRKFLVFFGVGAGYTFTVRPNYFYFDRRNIDGYYFRVFKNRDDRLFDIDKVIDSEARSFR